MDDTAFSTQHSIVAGLDEEHGHLRQNQKRMRLGPTQPDGMVVKDQKRQRDKEEEVVEYWECVVVRLHCYELGWLFHFSNCSSI